MKPHDTKGTNSRKYVKVEQGSQYLVNHKIMHFYRFIYAKRGLISLLGQAKLWVLKISMF